MILVLMGVAGAGKSTVGRMLAERLGWEFHDADDYHLPTSIEKMHKGIPLEDRDRWPWLDAVAACIKGCVREGRSAVLACSALRADYRARLCREPSQVRFVYLRATFDMAHGRLDKRHHPFMNPSLLRSQFDALEEPEDALVLDVSGTADQVVDSIIEQLHLEPR
jgi:gluconokinase